MSGWNRRKTILAGIAAMFAPAAVKAAVPSAAPIEADYLWRGGTPILSALDSEFSFAKFGSYLLVTDTAGGMKTYNVGPTLTPL